MANFKIGEFAAAAGVSRDTIRHYERVGLLLSAARTGAGYRVYGDDELERLQFIRLVQELGFSLEQTRELLQASNASRVRLAALLGAVRSKLDATKDNVERLMQIERALARMSKEAATANPRPLWMRLRDEATAEQVAWPQYS